MANPAALAAAAIAAGLAWLMSRSKKEEMEELEPSLSVETTATPSGMKAKGEVLVPPGSLTPGATTAPAIVDQASAEQIAATLAKAADTKSAGLPPLPSVKVATEPAGTGSTSGATSVASDGSTDDAFNELLAKAIANKDIEQLIKLAAQAEARGLLDIARSIRDEIARLTETAPPPTSVEEPAPKPAPTGAWVGRAMISYKAGSRGPDVIDWQRVVGVTQDGIFGPITDKATRAWQKAHPPLVVDGIVGPKTWEAAYKANPWLATTPRGTVVDSLKPQAKTTTTTTTTSTRPTLRRGSTGSYVKEWQKILGNVTVDGIFGPKTEAATKAWQQARPPLVVDGIVGPKTWSAALTGVPAPIMSAAPEPAPTPVQEPQASIVESPQRTAAKAITDYLTSIGGLAGRRKEDKSKIKQWQSALGLTADGLYGRNTAKAVILQGFVPVVPYYWPRTNTTQAKAEFTALVKQYADTDPNRKAAWDKLLSDIQRS